MFTFFRPLVVAPPPRTSALGPNAQTTGESSSRSGPPSRQVPARTPMAQTQAHIQARPQAQSQTRVTQPGAKQSTPVAASVTPRSGVAQTSAHEGLAPVRTGLGQAAPHLHAPSAKQLQAVQPQAVRSVAQAVVATPSAMKEPTRGLASSRWATEDVAQESAAASGVASPAAAGTNLATKVRDSSKESDEVKATASAPSEAGRSTPLVAKFAALNLDECTAKLGSAENTDSKQGHGTLPVIPKTNTKAPHRALSPVPSKAVGDKEHLSKPKKVKDGQAGIAFQMSGHLVGRDMKRQTCEVVLKIRGVRGARFEVELESKVAASHNVLNLLISGQTDNICTLKFRTEDNLVAPYTLDFETSARCTQFVFSLKNLEIATKLQLENELKRNEPVVPTPVLTPAVTPALTPTPTPALIPALTPAIAPAVPTNAVEPMKPESAGNGSKRVTYTAEELHGLKPKAVEGLDAIREKTSQLRAHPRSAAAHFSGSVAANPSPAPPRTPVRKVEQTGANDDEVEPSDEASRMRKKMAEQLEWLSHGSARKLGL